MSISLNVLQPDAPGAFDNSILSTFQRCPRKAFYTYYLDRAAKGKSYSIQFGVAYHRFREILEKAYLRWVADSDTEISEVEDELFAVAWSAALQAEDGFEDPPVENRKSYLNTERLRTSCEDAFENWKREKSGGDIEVLFPERAFELELPNGELYIGKMDQVILWNDDVWVRDFKTTSRMGRTYADNFDPNNQFTGYVWAAQQLSGRKVQGVMVETLYNNKSNVAVFKQFLTTRTPGEIEEWVEETMYEIETARRYEEDGIFPKRTTACSDYGGCFFRDACSKSNWRSRERWLESHTIESHWDPREADEEATEAIADPTGEGS